ncbi:uncharacterized protein LOC124156973 isoform X1 [Ischnura elegans]|uniref:uncharacterized protein LOC124156973 isoform X1 n=1 Tax=Ischnura elegans TaxID=197161 RepID=UPI001ED8947F|nr:uncharacterized protein LOC124156973 isoform X1 [Ischnura elegans]
MVLTQTSSTLWMDLKRFIALSIAMALYPLWFSVAAIFYLGFRFIYLYYCSADRHSYRSVVVRSTARTSCLSTARHTTQRSRTSAPRASSASAAATTCSCTARLRTRKRKCRNSLAWCAARCLAKARTSRHTYGQRTSCVLTAMRPFSRRGNLRRTRKRRNTTVASSWIALTVVVKRIS